MPRPPHPRAARARSWAWLLALAVWWTLAQMAASVHVLQHVQAQAQAQAQRQERDGPAQLPSTCDTCLLAAAIGGAAPPTAHVLSLPATAPQALAADPGASARTLAPALAYRSRAPPALHA